MSDDSNRISRRAINASLVGALAWPHAAFAAQPARRRLQEMVLSLFGDPAHACALGLVCLDAVPPDTGSLEALEAAILAAAGDTRKTLASVHAIRRELTHRISADFASGAVVTVDGWHLSVTEMQLYALVAIHAGGAADNKIS